MQTIAHYLEQDHRHCDELYNLAEASIAGRDWAAATTGFATFLWQFERHLDKEERVLFARLERVMQNACGPTSVMRMEHGQMRDTLRNMGAALAQRDSDSYFDHADTLRVLMRQHNLKEEGVLYPLADRVLQEQADAIIASMDYLERTTADAEVAA
ncbi:hemerythrin domain-containing protein [Duganella violaceipulchra]|uniref:Hemerythrin domain-containing protein n=1 Tax=Duganella violaceipulchra TaxID=2849652 RepID=A0AA41HGF8_9BURK|nr:hemerythrin domain-containing protein [Duganella violaceicalia]MBV6323288.1 hemerythrin domain-containing protein [Duganella violaceicalia]MCP2007762.1 hemerythrin-like domain-containing protein [Duganella violaceicalia]